MLPAHYRNKEPAYFCRFTFGQFFTLLVLEIFTLFFIFYLGARYGKELLGLSPPIDIASAPTGLPQVTETDPKKVALTHDPEIQALAKDLLQSAPTPDLKQRVAEMLEQEKGGEVSPPPTPTKPKTQAVAKTEVKAEPVESPSLEESPEEDSVIQTAPQGRFTIQVGSYTNLDEAHAMVARWKTKGYPAYLVSADIPDKGRWYRVRLGGFEDRNSADTYLEKFKTQEGVDAFVASKE